jgi:hypothetical protein
MAQIFPRWTNLIPTVGVPALGGVVAFVIFAVWFWFSPKHTDVGYTPVQPIPYSHKLHAGDMQMDCRYCHYNVERSAHAGVPPTQVCMNCHSQVKKDSPKLEALRASWAEGKDGGPVPWKRIHKAPDYVYFNHSAHVANVGNGPERAAIGCESCHGRIDLMEVVGQQQPLSMSWCLDCHNNTARFLRPADQVTKMGWKPELGWGDRAAEISKTLHPPGRVDNYTTNPDGTHTTRATYGCNGCHR